jgi:hypothetical protein
LRLNVEQPLLVLLRLVLILRVVLGLRCEIGRSGVGGLLIELTGLLHLGRRRFARSIPVSRIILGKRMRGGHYGSGSDRATGGCGRWGAYLLRTGCDNGNHGACDSETGDGEKGATVPMNRV